MIKKLLLAASIAGTTLHSETTLAQNNSDSTLKAQTRECFKELCICLETSPDSLKSLCFNQLSFVSGDIQEEFLKKDPQKILNCSNSKSTKLVNTEHIEIYKEMMSFLKQGWEKDKRGLSEECEKILTETHTMREKGMLSKEILTTNILLFNKCREKQ